ncbi:MAG: glycosyltransferase family 2 protein [Prevotella sp.]|nr:glycosyltransferase family 2 protein [Prevotella sp.]
MLSLISIIVPVYNAERFLSKCVSSILNSTYKDFELILVDDGSTDNSPIICDQFAQKDNRIKIVHKHNEGVTKARIDGYNRCLGDYVTFIDADDYISNVFLERLINIAILDNSDIVSCQYYNVREDIIEPCKRMIIGRFEREGIKKILYESNSYYIKNNKLPFAVFLWGKLFKKDILHGSLEKGLGLWHGEDFACTLDLLMHKINSITMLEDSLYYYVHHVNQVTSMFRNDIWKGYEDCWERLIEIDNEDIWKEQMPYRIKNSAMTCIYRFKKGNMTRRSFIEKLKEISNSKVMSTYVFNNICALSIPLKDKIRLYLLKYHKYSSLYYLIR